MAVSYNFEPISAQYHLELQSALNLIEELTRILEDPADDIKPLIDNGSLTETEFVNQEKEKFAKISLDIRFAGIRLNILQNMTIVYMFSLFEAFLKECLRMIFLVFPHTMKSNEKKIDYGKLLNFHSFRDLLCYLANEETDKIGYMSIDKFSKYLSKEFKISLENDFPNWKGLRENCYRRNIIIHNSGMISKQYIKKMNLDPSKIDTEVINDIFYIRDCFYNFYRAIEFLTEKFNEKFCRSFF